MTTDEIAEYNRVGEANHVRKWRPANNGVGKRIYFLIRADWGDRNAEYHYGPSGRLIRYASYVTAQRAADKLNA